MSIFRKQTALLLAALMLSVGGASAAGADPGPAERTARLHKAEPAVKRAVDRAGLTEHLGADPAVHVSEHFILVHAAEESAWARRTARVLERSHAEFRGVLDRAGFEPEPLRDRLVWLYFENRDRFQNYALAADRVNMAWSEGYYSTRTNRVAVLPEASGPGGRPGDPGRSVMRADHRGAGVAGVAEAGCAEPGARPGPSINVKRTRHEAAHQLAYNLGLQRRGVMYPIWISEGVATSFEIGGVGRAGAGLGAGLGRDNPARRRRLIEAANAGRLQPLHRFVTLTMMAQNADAPALRDLYAQSWGFFHFLFKRRREALDRYLDALARVEPGWRTRRTMYREFVDAFGPLKSLRVSWQRFLNQLRTVSLVRGE